MVGCLVVLLVVLVPCVGLLVVLVLSVGLFVVLVLRVGLLVVLVLGVGLLVVLVLRVGLLVVLCVVLLVETGLAVVVCLAWFARLIKVRPHRPQGGLTHRPQGTLLKETSIDVEDCPIMPSRESRRRGRADAISISRCVSPPAFLFLLCCLPALL